MGYLSDVLRKKTNRDTANMFLSAYQKSVAENPNAGSDAILASLLSRRRFFPWVVCGYTPITFSYDGYQAIIIDENTKLHDLVIWLIFWEQIIAKPDDVRYQSISYAELWHLMSLIYDSVIYVIYGTLPSNRNEQIDDYTNKARYITEALGGRVL